MAKEYENNKKKIAIVHGPLVIGGAEKALISMLHYIDYSKYDVTLWLKDNTGLMQEQVDERVNIRYWGTHIEKDYSRFIKDILKHGMIIKVVYSLVCRVMSRLFVKKWHTNFKYYLKSLLPLTEECYDIAISYHSLVKEDIMILSYSMKSKMKIGWIHGACNHNLDDEYFESFLIEYKKMDYIFCVSEWVKNIFIDKYPVLQAKVKVMYNLQNFQEIIRLSKEKVDVPFDKLTVVTVGRLSVEKGQDMIPFIARNLLDKGYEFVWYIVGDGDLRDKIESEIRMLHIETYVVLLGKKVNPYPYMEQCSIYVQPSYTEGFSLTTFEAKILNKLLVVTDVPIMRELFGEEEAIICDATVDSLTEGIQEAIERVPFEIHQDTVFTDEYNYTEIKKLYDLIKD